MVLPDSGSSTQGDNPPARPNQWGRVQLDTLATPPMKQRTQTLVGASLIALLSSCSSSDGNSGGSSGGGQTPGIEVEFGTQATIVEEDATYVEVDLVLNKAAKNLVIVDFYETGDATVFADYHVITTSPLQIPPGVVASKILVQVFEDSLGEKDEILTLNLMTPMGGTLGDNVTHDLTITDEDAQIIIESEPNNDVQTADIVGGIQETLSYQATGSISTAFEEYDVFQVTATDNTDVFIQLIPSNGTSEMRIHIMDANGVILFSYAGSGGDTVTTEYEAVNGEIFNVAVWVESADTSYVLDLVGLKSTLTSNGGPGTGSSDLTIMGRSAGSDLGVFRAWLAAKSLAEASAVLSEAP